MSPVAARRLFLVTVVRAALLVVATLAVSTASHAEEIRVELVRVTSPVVPFTDAMIEVMTAPKARCDIAVLYKSGPSRARGLVPRDADPRGRVSWTWRVGSNTTPGQWPIIVTCWRGRDTGELRTEFEVR